MKNKNLIIKIALGVSIVAVLFSVVTLIRAIIIHSMVVFPIIQVIGSIAIAGICYYLFKMLRSANSEEESEDESDEQTESEQEPEKSVDEKTEDKTEEEIETDTGSEEKRETEASDDKDDEYHFSNFMK